MVCFERWPQTVVNMFYILMEKLPFVLGLSFSVCLILFYSHTIICIHMFWPNSNISTAMVAARENIETHEEMLSPGRYGLLVRAYIESKKTPN